MIWTRDRFSIMCTFPESPKYYQVSTNNLLYFEFNETLVMPREHVILECTEARDENKPVSWYMTTRDKKKQPERIEKKKYNPFMRKHTVHKEIR